MSDIRKETALSPAPTETNHDRLRTLASQAVLFDEFRTVHVDTASNYTITENDVMLIVDTSGGNVAIAFPPAAEIANRWFTFKKTSTLNVLTLNPDGAELIDNAATFAPATGALDAIQVYCDGTEFWVTISAGSSGGAGAHQFNPFQTVFGTREVSYT